MDDKITEKIENNETAISDKVTRDSIKTEADKVLTTELKTILATTQDPMRRIEILLTGILAELKVR